jgi:hypothetical protein
MCNVCLRDSSVNCFCGQRLRRTSKFTHSSLHSGSETLDSSANWIRTRRTIVDQTVLSFDTVRLLVGEEAGSKIALIGHYAWISTRLSRAAQQTGSHLRERKTRKDRFSGLASGGGVACSMDNCKIYKHTRKRYSKLNTQTQS